MSNNERIQEGPQAYCDAAAQRFEELKTAFPPQLRTLPKLLLRQAERYGARALFKSGDRIITFAQAPEVAARMARALLEHGVARGDRVAVMSANRAEFLELVLGIGWLGATIVPINIASKGFQLQHMLSNSGAKLLLVDPERLSALETVDRSMLPLTKILLVGEAGDSVASPDIGAYPAAGEALPERDLAISDFFAILYTSGTTGVSKGVCCSHGQMFWWGMYTSRQLGVRDGDVLNTTLPLFHTNALNCFFQALLNGATQVLEPRFSVSNFWTRLHRSDATVTYLLGAMVPMLLSQAVSPAERSHGVRVALAPGVPAQFHREFFERSGIVLLDGFGSTESNAVIGAEMTTLRPGSMGRLADGFQARVVDENDYEVPDGQAGELVLRADEPFAFASGYFAMPEKTVEAWRNLWLHTGDRVIRTADGYFLFIDRMKDAIRRRGENISSYEVEQVLLSFPAVALAAAFPVSSELAEDEVMVAIVLKQGENCDPVDLIRHCESRMPYYAVPRFIDVVEDLPRTANGKVQKFILKERGVTHGTWDRVTAGVEIRR